jgi:hypothetical protein
LGRLALVPAGDSGTIPETMRGSEQVMYPGWRCDSAGEPGSGSRLFFINSWAMIWPSDYPKIVNWETFYHRSVSKVVWWRNKCLEAIVLSSQIQFCIHKHICTYRYVQIRTDTYRYVHIRTDTYTYVRIRTHTYIRTWLFFSTNAYECVRIRTYVNVNFDCVRPILHSYTFVHIRTTFVQHSYTVVRDSYGIRTCLHSRFCTPCTNCVRMLYECCTNVVRMLYECCTNVLCKMLICKWRQSVLSTVCTLHWYLFSVCSVQIRTDTYRFVQIRTGYVRIRTDTYTYEPKIKTSAPKGTTGGQHASASVLKLQ